MTWLGALSADTFLREYWQRAPLLIRNALPGFRSPLTPEELAGLACEPEVDSRIVLEEGGAYPWEVRHGPFESADFERLPEGSWSLLVHEVDRLVPEVTALLSHVRFFPNWRLDDVMVSYAPEGASVGAHVDAYDVFLLQGSGRRRWSIGRDAAPEAPRLTGDLQLVPDFRPDQSWELEAGDLLYLPPGIVHHGVALEPCLTYSIGFRAPAKREALLDYVETFSTGLPAESRYTDPPLRSDRHPGEITVDELERIRCMVRALAYDDAAIDRWFGRFITTPRGSMAPEDEGIDVSPVASRPKTEISLERSEPARGPAGPAGWRGARALRRAAISELAFIQSAEGEITLFARGHAITLPPDSVWAARAITGAQPIRGALLVRLKEEQAELIDRLVDIGALVPGDSRAQRSV